MKIHETFGICRRIASGRLPRMGEIEHRERSLIAPRAAAEFPPFRYAPLRQFSGVYRTLSDLGDFFDCTFLDNSILYAGG